MMPKVILSDCLERRNCKRKVKSEGSATKKHRSQKGTSYASNDSESVSSVGSDNALQKNLPNLDTGLLTPSPSRASSESSDEMQNSELQWDKDELFEIEKIDGYHIDNKGHMTYYIKWKGYDNYNTYEPIENLVNCNFMLMKLFEPRRPKPWRVKILHKRIEHSLTSYPEYEELVRSNFGRNEIELFSKHVPNVVEIFGQKLHEFHNHLKKEYSYILRCLVGMEEKLHIDKGMFVRAQNYRIGLKLCEMRAKQLEKIELQRKKICEVESCPVYVENTWDLDCLPEDVEYVTKLVPQETILVPEDPPIGCDCRKGCSTRSKCCGRMSHSTFAYNDNCRLRTSEKIAIYECNVKCTCPPTCKNRVVQNGRTIELTIFKTEKCGWGVKTRSDIPCGVFVAEYVGELIHDSEAAVRDIEYVSKNISYLFNLDFTPDGQQEYCIDAAKKGNLSRYINHSCNPNLMVYPVWINCLDPYIPRLAFFTRRSVSANEELTIDYESRSESVQPGSAEEYANPPVISKERCHCNSDNCREWIFGNR